MIISMQQAYSTLGLTRAAGSDEVRKAYRKLALQFHPDKNPGSEATAKFQLLSAAYKLVDDQFKHDSKGFDSHFCTADFDNRDEGVLKLYDLYSVPSMTKMLFMFDMLIKSSPQATRRQNEQKKRRGKARVQNRRKAGKHKVPFGLPACVDNELMDLFAKGLMLGDLDSELYVFENELRFMSSLFADTNSKHFSAEKTERGSKYDNEAETNAGADLTLHIGTKVCIHGKHSGVVEFSGLVHYAKGEFVGVALSLPVGRNDGSIKGVRYFKCRPSHGLMVRPTDVTFAA